MLILRNKDTMDYLISKTKGINGSYYRVLSDVTVFDSIEEPDNARSYDDEYKLQEREWFVVENFSTKEYCISLLQEDFIPTSYSYMRREDYKKIDFVVSIQNDRYFLFQKITPSYLYSRKSMISWGNLLNPSEQARLIKEDNILVIKDTPDCIFVKDTDKLYFKNLSAITSIFNGINELYREATDDEVETFLSMDIINLESDFSKDQVKTANRRRIKEAAERYNNFSAEQKSRIPNYISQYCPNLYDATTNRFRISNEKELTELLNSLNQRYYTTEIDGEKRLANSVTKL